MAEISDTLKELDRWYSELPGGTERPTLISKLAVLELCGWLEIRFDALIDSSGKLVGLDAKWIDEQVVKRNYGFTYADHLRAMLCRLVGEAAVLHVEAVFEIESPGKLEQLKGTLTNLWKIRGVLAHTHSASPVRRQTTVNAPSWAINQQRILEKAIDQYEACIIKVFSRSIAAPVP